MGTAEQGTREVKMTCPVCGGTDLDREQGRMDSRWGLTSHKMVISAAG